MQILINIEDSLWDELTKIIHKEFMVENLYGSSPKSIEAEIKKRIKEKTKRCIKRNLLFDIERG
jgi:hypothetical protein